jgi:hypothetical protein
MAVQAMSSKESKAGRGVPDLAYMFGGDINLQGKFNMAQQSMSPSWLRIYSCESSFASSEFD